MKSPPAPPRPHHNRHDPATASASSPACLESSTNSMPKDWCRVASNPDHAKEHPAPGQQRSGLRKTSNVRGLNVGALLDTAIVV